MGLPTMTIILLIENQRFPSSEYPAIKPVFEFFKPLFDFLFVKSSTNNYQFYMTGLVLVFDVGRMLLLTWASWAVSKWYTKNQIKML